MINFFRKKRKTLANENKALKYTRYAIGEIVLVVIGILIALQLNTWNEGRKQKALEIDILKEVKNGLISDLDDANYNLNANKKKYSSQNLIISWLESDLIYNDTLSTHFSEISYGTYFASNKGPYQTLKQLGMRTIKNDSLRNQISKLYELKYEQYNVYNEEYKKLNYLMFPGYSKYFNEISYYELNMKPTDIVGLKKDNEFSFALKTTKNFNVILINSTIPEVILEINKTLTMINNEIDSIE
ncbi:MAG: hypothetical protein COB12_01985 [Flavobacterium sp.]|nr:MAG: hypothetical protein COB12_01985 [Flavobacterium sp.]